MRPFRWEFRWDGKETCADVEGSRRLALASLTCYFQLRLERLLSQGELIFSQVAATQHNFETSA